MSDLLVDYDRLSSLGQQLANLRGEFNAARGAIGPTLGTVSDGELRAKLQGFTDNWSHERTKLATRLHKCSEFATRAASCYLHADETLAEALTRRR